MTQEAKQLKIEEFRSNLFLDIVRIGFLIADLTNKNTDLLAKNETSLREQLEATRKEADELTEEQKTDKSVLLKYGMQINELQTDLDTLNLVTKKLGELNESLLATKSMVKYVNDNIETILQIEA